MMNQNELDKFSAEELGKFLRMNFELLDDESIEHLRDMKVQFHTFGPISALLKFLDNLDIKKPSGEY